MKKGVKGAFGFGRNEKPRARPKPGGRRIGLGNGCGTHNAVKLVVKRLRKTLVAPHWGKPPLEKGEVGTLVESEKSEIPGKFSLRAGDNKHNVECSRTEPPPKLKFSASLIVVRPRVRYH